MNFVTVALGLGKAAFGLAVAAVVLFLAARGIPRALKLRREGEPGHKNLAASLVEAAGLIALGILARPAVTASFDATDVILRAPDRAGAAELGKLALAALLHLLLTLGAGVSVLVTSVWVFNRLTRDVDELVEVQNGNASAAVILGAILVVVALLTSPGLEAALVGLVPFPELPAGRAILPR